MIQFHDKSRINNRGMMAWFHWFNRRPTFDLMVRSERLAAAAAILRMSGLLLDFMISGREKWAKRSNKEEEQRKELVLRCSEC